ncbi:endonuclease [Polycladomyces sp. WAk]|uniref:Endonuclease n=1 Tax=Polycladomyces zharkentensis TaxID=2807616 RepID=A0ABS2WFV6_9BACL|nr:endonuclease [Polycladomyces sp. WAk]MBN2908412.1 endonuclease [Polycladomyces sp. WAk]
MTTKEGEKLKRDWVMLFEALRKWRPNLTVDGWWEVTDPFFKSAGCVLVQNTSWHNACLAIDGLCSRGMTTPSALLQASDDTLWEAIRPAGFYRAKSAALRGLYTWLNTVGGWERAKKQSASILRVQLLGIRGIGSETADMLLLYMLEKKTFIGDAYTRRIAARWFGGPPPTYETVRAEVLESLTDVPALQLFHALLVELGKEHCKKNVPGCTTCPIRGNCAQHQSRSA